MEGSSTAEQRADIAQVAGSSPALPTTQVAPVLAPLFNAEREGHPGVTTSPHIVLAAPAIGRAEAQAAGATAFVDLPLEPMTSDVAMAILFEAGWPAEWVPDIMAIGECESHRYPGETGDSGNSLGWLQLWHGWFAAAGEDISRWWDPLVNARVGLYVRQVRGHYGGAGGWSCADRLGIR